MPWPLTLIAALGLATTPPALAAADTLDRYRWTARVVVAVAPSPGDPRLAEQARILAGTRGAMQERDLVLVSASGSSTEAEALRQRFGIPRGEFRAILVGKDGGAKRVLAAPIPAEHLFAEIDAMPMRQQEMRRQLSGRGGR